MNREKMIKNIIEETAEKLGFYYEGCSQNGDVTDYTFERKKESEFDVSQGIWILIFDNYRGGYDIRLTFAGTKRIEAYRLIESKFQEGDVGNCLHFEDEKELEQILRLFREIIEKKGETIFSEIRKPQEDIKKNRDMHWKLYQEHEALNKTYRKLYDMEDTQFTAKLIRRMSDVILARKDDNFEEVEELLLGMAAIYGDQLIRKRGGEWAWEDSFCIIQGIQDSYYEIPLQMVRGYWRWKRQDYNYFLDHFRSYPTETII